MAAVLKPGSPAFTSPARGQGIVAPIRATMRSRKAGIGQYDNGLAAPPPPPPPTPTEEELHVMQNLSRALLLEQECCDKVLALLHDMILQGDGTAETADAVAAIVESKEVFSWNWKRRVPGTWKATLPPSTTRYLVEEVITPRMAVDAREWLPPWDPVCHHWLRPLIPLVGHLPECLYGVVESKISNADDYDVVSPWKQYLDPTRWDVFCRRHILPMLARLVRELRVTPPKQTDSSFRTVMVWAPLARAQDVVSMLEAESFFDKWKCALRHWLLAARPPLAEATAWCDGWKNLFTPELLADERVLAHLEAGLGMVNHAAQASASLV